MTLFKVKNINCFGKNTGFFFRKFSSVDFNISQTCNNDNFIVKNLYLCLCGEKSVYEVYLPNNKV